MGKPIKTNLVSGSHLCTFNKPINFREGKRLRAALFHSAQLWVAASELKNTAAVNEELGQSANVRHGRRHRCYIHIFN